MTRYYVKPSRTAPGSFNVYDREAHAPEGGDAVEIAHETERGAKMCAGSLNRGADAYAWLSPVPRDDFGAPCTVAPDYD